MENMSASKSFTLAQSRFLGERLKMDGFEQLARESPRRFLEQFVRGMRLNSPYNTAHHLQAIKKNGQVNDILPSCNSVMGCV